MSFLTTVAKINTANQLTAWNTSCVSAMNQAKSTFSSIATQRVAMETNTDYTQEDKDAIDAMLANLNTLAKTLITPEPTPVLTPIPTPIV